MPVISRRSPRSVRPFAVSAQSPYDYWFVTSTLRRVPRKVALFRDWVMEELET